jgi:hypothetical protein
VNEGVGPPGHPVGAEIRRSLEGAARLFLFDPKGMQAFTLTIGGFWRSFLAALVAAPLQLLGIVISNRLLRQLPDLDITLAPLPARLTAEILAYPLRWALFPVLMIGLARLLKGTARYVPYMVAYNWSGVVASLIGLTPLLLYAIGVFGTETAIAAIQGIQLIVWIYLWFIARTALGVGWAMAIGLVLIDVLSTNLFDHALAFLLGES